MPTLNDICKLVGGELKGPPDFEITGVGSLECAGPTEIAAIDSAWYQRAARGSNAGAFLVSRTLDEEFDRPCRRSGHALDGLNRVIESLGLAIPDPERESTSGRPSIPPQRSGRGSTSDPMRWWVPRSESAQAVCSIRV